MKMDLLFEVYHNRLKEADAERVVDNYFEKYHNDELLETVQDLLMLSLSEYTAYAVWSLEFGVIAGYRYNGWPSKCSLCSKELQVDKGFWRVDVTNEIVCIEC
ncbi:hypothetical protein [Bacillus suaedaesalsae]|uniref:Uncharacterized protein n=1 Tax=Bacillus suaedaesalsae TaxID=2810349 RepID=A0ABS2DKW2_9BACI|nr:hypothetical protein [Bacillus suaedaesalsae]MBM6619132.1 hypothetical protein [Bacillus suaedaesalsae]